MSSTHGSERDWSFALRPKWLLSHLFVGSLIAAFIFAMFWQLDRHDEVVARNEIIESRALAVPTSLSEALDQAGELVEDELDYVAISDVGRYVEPELIRVANRSQGGAAGDWVVGLFELDDGGQVLVNRGFIPREVDAAPATDGAINGWLRVTREKELFGAEVGDEGERIPRLDVVAIEERFGVDVAPLWLQLDSPGTESFPEPVPLPTLDNGPHLSYAGQWAIFSILGVGVYGLMLRKRAAPDRESVPPLDAPEAAVGPDADTLESARSDHAS